MPLCFVCLLCSALSSWLHPCRSFASSGSSLIGAAGLKERTESMSRVHYSLLLWRISHRGHPGRAYCYAWSLQHCHLEPTLNCLATKSGAGMGRTTIGRACFGKRLSGGKYAPSGSSYLLAGDSIPCTAVTCCQSHQLKC